MDVFTALGLVTLGGLLGVVGQGMRVIVGIKKDWEEAAKSEEIKDLTKREKELHKKIKELDEKISEAKKSDAKEKELIEKWIAEKKQLMEDKEMVLKQIQALEWFSWNELLTSLIIALVIGAIAGILAGITLPTQEIDMRAMLSIIAAGYAGTDFIEGFMKARMPK